MLAAFAFAAIAVLIALMPGKLPDFFIYRLGSELTLHGTNPYDLDTIRNHVKEQFPEENPTEDSFVKNCGYFLPPQAVVLFAPFAAVPFPTAKILWALLQGACGFAI